MKTPLECIEWLNALEKLSSVSEFNNMGCIKSMKHYLAKFVEYENKQINLTPQLIDLFGQHAKCHPEYDDYFIGISELESIVDELKIKLPTPQPGDEKLVMPKIAEETAKYCVQQLREEFLLNTQNYPREYHDMFYKKAKRVIDKINEKYGSNFSA